MQADPPPSTPDWSPLFEDVQLKRALGDGKTFVDCVPKRPRLAILADYARAQPVAGGPDLRKFVEDNFTLPQDHGAAPPSGETVAEHIRSLWKVLRREPDLPQPGSSLLPLRFPYVVPGGRFRELYYWDSYFTMLGLRESGEEELIEHLVKNFSDLIGRYGFVPNGTRSYFLSRSQPPYFSLMVDFLAEKKGASAYLEHRAALQAEHDYWADKVAATQHAVALPDGTVLQRFFDQQDLPRIESYAEDVELARRSAQEPRALFRHVRSATESGWDFSSRWFADHRTLESIRTTELIPVDLNCLLYHLETTLATAALLARDKPQNDHYRRLAARRGASILRHCWSESAGFFCDYDLAARQPSDHPTIAGVLPLFFKIATPRQAASVQAVLQEKFLKRGGLQTTLVETGQQWDAPNGWAPAQWLAIGGLENYGHHALAAEVARRWIRLNLEVYQRTGRFDEKYNVGEAGGEAGGGEYINQCGFGWTNGVLLDLMRRYN